MSASAGAPCARHAVQFFADEAALERDLVDYLQEGFAQGDAALVIARAARCRRLVEGLAGRGLDPAHLRAEGRLVVLDAEATLDVVTDGDGAVSLEQLQRALGPRLAALTAPGAVRVFGEMVDLLAERGALDEAVRLELAWNDLVADLPVTVRCGYPLERFHDPAGASAFDAVCAAHDAVVPVEDPAALEGAALRRRVARLERDAAALNDELARRRRTEAHLERVARASAAFAGPIEAAAVVDALLDLLVPDLGDAATVELLDRAGRFDRGVAATSRAPAVDVPIEAGARPLGALTLHLRDGRDLPIVTELVRRAATALDNARLHRESRQALERLRELDRRKDEFMAMLGHELRNPLAPILTALELLDRRGEQAAARERAIIGRQARHLARLVDDLLDLSRIERGKVDLRREDLAVEAAVARAVELAQPLLIRARHALVIDVAAGLRVDADPVRLSQALGNLVANAARYTPDGGSVAVRATLEGADVRLDVVDDGEGLTADMVERVFEPFVQAPRALDRSEGGLGIGLTVARRLIELHGGTVVASSAGPGQGSTFTVRLPALGPPPPPDGGRAADADAEEGARAAPRRRRVLVVDDNVDAADLLGDVLTAVGFEVAVAHAPAGALELAAPFAPDVALLDLGLPGMDGFELAAHLRGAAGDVRLVAITGYGQEQDRERSRAAGFDAHLVKPAPIEEILAAIGPAAA